MSYYTPFKFFEWHFKPDKNRTDSKDVLKYVKFKDERSGGW